jgi:hypothetical protein
MKPLNVTEQLKQVLEPKIKSINARLFVAREDGITIYDSVQNQTTASVSALVSGVWQASEALMGLAHPGQDILEFRLGFDTSSQGIYLFPLSLFGKRYFFGAIYKDCLNPGQLKRQIVLIRHEMDQLFSNEKVVVTTTTKMKNNDRNSFLFQEITDEEIDRLFSAGCI